MNDYATVENPALWRRSLVRAKLMEELSKHMLPELSSEAYLAGLFSLLDIILDVDIPGFLKELNVDDRIVSAFTDRESPLGRLLSIVKLLEEKEKEISDLKDDHVKISPPEFCPSSYLS